MSTRPTPQEPPADERPAWSLPVLILLALASWAVVYGLYCFLEFWARFLGGLRG